MLNSLTGCGGGLGERFTSEKLGFVGVAFAFDFAKRLEEAICVDRYSSRRFAQWRCLRAMRLRSPNSIRRAVMWTHNVEKESRAATAPVAAPHAITTAMTKANARLQFSEPYGLAGMC
jgi:hypothetical protein